ncbi:L,D-transpeptidase [bacterium]|nr:L,D-transpeptidase [bacterium]MDA7672350.1 L,D-transpeptidase [Akkermansiaceae bacterium]MDA7864285.1 L,D-transpeptidase [Akkermansiaceae bacterium]MDB4259758.1 L,D-transpeptidase [Akkermansiaceae bacterium]MDB4268445.1 L,D-transpeptidase [Akkermansiaceae bacterium]
MSPDKPGYLVESAKYQATSPLESRIKISLWDQKAWLLNGAGEAVLEADVATGVPGKETPVGSFAILERLESKRSNRYGRYVGEDSRKVVVEKAWEHEGEPPEGTVYEGISMPYWMRLTWTGIGMHVGKFNKRTRSSFGCIRVFEKAQPLIFEKSQLGTPVEIVAESLVVMHGLR